MGRTGSFDQEVVYDDGLPADGSAFITRGYLYEPGTLTCDAEGRCDGVNADGSPQFPEQLVGEWICSGSMINDAGHATGGVWVFSTQLFQLSDTPGAETISAGIWANCCYYSRRPTRCGFCASPVRCRSALMWKYLQGGEGHERRRHSEGRLI